MLDQVLQFGPTLYNFRHAPGSASFAPPALVAFAEFAGSEVGAIWRNETVESTGLAQTYTTVTVR